MKHRLIGAGVGNKTVGTLMAALFVGLAEVFLKSAWGDAKEQAEESANPRQPWRDKNRWED